VPTDIPPTFDPKTYRDGIKAAGPDVGMWTSIQLHDGLVRVAYVDNDTGAVHLASEQSDGSYVMELVDDNTGEGGATYVSLSLSSSGEPTVAYRASVVDNNGFFAELRASSRANGWQPQVVDTAPISCGGLCGDQVCVAETNQCTSGTNDCAVECGGGEACVAAQCVAIVDEPPVEMIEGTGLYASLLHKSDDSMVLGYYDRVLGDVRIAASSGGSGFAPVTSYNDDALDTGMWLTLKRDNADLVHLAFQDATGDRLMYSTFDGATIAPPMIVDDGVREGDDRTHPVGASASLLIEGDRAPRVLYQDGLTADLEIATLEQNSWQRRTLLGGERLDGFFISTTSLGNTSWMAQYFYDLSVYPPGDLEISLLAN
jgi:hypothetical protein